jgi:hypothetical protein
MLVYFLHCCVKGLDKLNVHILKEIFKKFRTIWIHNRTGVWLGLQCLKSLSTIFQLCHGGQLYLSTLRKLLTSQTLSHNNVV